MGYLPKGGGLSSSMSSLLLLGFFLFSSLLSPFAFKKPCAFSRGDSWYLRLSAHDISAFSLSSVSLIVATGFWGSLRTQTPGFAREFFFLSFFHLFSLYISLYLSVAFCLFSLSLPLDFCAKKKKGEKEYLIKDRENRVEKFHN